MMGFKFVVLWTDVALWTLFAAIAGYGIRVARHDNLRATWRRVLRDAPAMCSALILGLLALDLGVQEDLLLSSSPDFSIHLGLAYR